MQKATQGTDEDPNLAYAWRTLGAAQMCVKSWDEGMANSEKAIAMGLHPGEEQAARGDIKRAQAVVAKQAAKQAAQPAGGAPAAAAGGAPTAPSQDPLQEASTLKEAGNREYTSGNYQGRSSCMRKPWWRFRRIGDQARWRPSSLPSAPGT